MSRQTSPQHGHEYTGPAGKPTLQVFLSKTEVAERIGMRSVQSLNKVPLPDPDARIGGTNGWLPVTIDAWHAARPGRGWHGGR